MFHIIGIGLWIGVEASVAGDIRRSLEKGQEHALYMAERIGRSLKISTIAGIVTLVSGGLLIALSGGMGGVPVRIHIGMTLTLVMLAINLALVRPHFSRLSEAVTGQDLNAAGALRKKVSMFLGIGHLLWLITLGLMVFKF